MSVQQNSMGSEGGTKAVGCNNGGYDGDGTSRITSGLWRNIGKHVWVVVNMGTIAMGEYKDGGMVGVGLMDGNNIGDGGGGVEAAMNMRMRGWKKKEERRKKIGKEEKKEDGEDGAAVSGRKWNRKEKQKTYLLSFF